MRTRKAFLTAALALAAGIVLVPAGTLARGGGGFHGAGHGPVFGFPRVHVAPHGPIAPRLVRRAPARFGFRLGWWNRHGARNGADASAIYPSAGGGYGAPYYPNDVTGTVAAPPPDMLLPRPASYAPDHVGCVARGYDVPSESGGLAKVRVTRC
jgi:hypothetical protein